MKPQDEDMEAEEDEPPEEQQTAEIEPPKRVTRAQARQERERLERGLPPPQQMRDEKGDDTEGKTEQVCVAVIRLFAKICIWQCFNFICFI